MTNHTLVEFHRSGDQLKCHARRRSKRYSRAGVCSTVGNLRNYPEWCVFHVLVAFILTWFAAPPFLASLSQGILDYPIFGLRLTRNSTGTLALGEDGFVMLEHWVS